MAYTGIATAVAREAAWLQIGTDTLPALQTIDGGPWDVVQGYWPGARLASQKTGIYVDASPIVDLRAQFQRIRPQYAFSLKCIWPVKVTTAPLAETAQQDAADALDLLLQRIRGLVGDKTHGGRFLSVGENPRRVDAVKADPEVTIPRDKALRYTVLYRADDFEFSG